MASKKKKGVAAGGKACAACGARGSVLSKCMGCSSVWYCNKDCQRTHWKAGHKTRCKERADAIAVSTSGAAPPAAAAAPGPELKPFEIQCPVCFKIVDYGEDPPPPPLGGVWVGWVGP